MSRLHHTVRARSDLLAIWTEIARDSPEAADRALDRIAARSLILEDFAEADVARPHIAPGARLLVEPPWLILYRIADGTVEIVRVVHGARNIDVALFSQGLE